MRASSEELVLVWLIESGKDSFTAQEVEAHCKPYWSQHGVHRGVVTFWRAAQRVKSEGYLGRVDELPQAQDGQRWIRFYFERAELQPGLARLIGRPGGIPHGETRMCT